MNIHKPARAFAALIIGTSCVLQSLAAQPSRLTPVAVGQIVDQVLSAVIPPGQPLSRVAVGRRGVFLDHARTLAAFGYRDTHATLSELKLRTALKTGRQSLLTDCDEWHKKPCAQLGWGVYVWIEPLSLTGNEAVVRAHFDWPDRGQTVFEHGVAPRGSAALVGFSTDVQLKRSSDGSWKFVKRLSTVAG